MIHRLHGSHKWRNAKSCSRSIHANFDQRPIIKYKVYFWNFTTVFKTADDSCFAQCPQIKKIQCCRKFSDKSAFFGWCLVVSMSSFLLLNPRVMSFIMALSKVWMANDSHRVWFLGVLLQKYNTMLLTQYPHWNTYRKSFNKSRPQIRAAPRIRAAFYLVDLTKITWKTE